MHSLHCYDKTIRDNHMYNLSVYVKDPDIRAGIITYLDGLGYDVDACCAHVGGHKTSASVGKKFFWDALVSLPHVDYDLISMNQIINISYGRVSVGCVLNRKEIREGKNIIDEMYRIHEDVMKKYQEIIDTKEKQDEKEMYQRMLENEKNTIICEDNVEFFKVLAGYRKDSDIGKVEYYYNPIPEWWQHLNGDGKKRTEDDRYWINVQWEDWSKCDIDWVKERCKLCTLEDLKIYYKINGKSEQKE